MRSWLAARWRIVVVVAAVVGLVATTVVTLAISNAGNESAADGFDCTQLEEVSFDEAGPKARACDAEVEVTTERTPWQTSWATPDGTTRLEASTVPTRTSASGEWTDIDTAIEGTPGEGVLEVAAPVYAIELNAGGEAGEGKPLGSITRDGKRLDVWFPTGLPVPVIEDSQLTYGLAEGVRLIVSVSGDGTGFVPVVELANPAAAERFRALVDAARPDGFPGRGGDLVFSTAMSDGLRLLPDGQGSVLVVDGQDDVAFVSSPPVMWDSAGGVLGLPESATEVGQGDRTRAPAAGDTITPMNTAVDGTRIVVSPDGGMLTRPDTVWPVYIDPSFNGHKPATNVAIRTGGYTGTLHNWRTDIGEGAGYCSLAVTSTCNVTFTQRLVWQFDGMDEVRNMVGSDVISAQFRVNGLHSYACSPTTTDLHMTGPISAGTTWNSLSWHDKVSSRNEYYSCANQGYREFDATSALRLFAENDLSTITLGLKANDESTMWGWKRFAHDATLSVEFNRAPNAPSQLLLTNPVSSSCVTGANRPFINSTTPTMSAVVTDPDGTMVNSRFYVVSTASPSVLLWDAAAVPWEAVSGTRFSSTVGANILSHGSTYSWRVLAGDWARLSPYSVSCEFTVDTQKPNAPAVTPVASGEGIQAVYERNLERGGKGLKGKFTLGPNGSTDVVGYRYSFGDPAALPAKPVTAGSALVIEYVPASAGPMTLYVESVDRAGNISTRTAYTFDVASPKEDAVWAMDEGSGSAAADTGLKGAGPLTISGAGWVGGPHELFGSRDGDTALKFDGVDDVASNAPILDTSKPFAVSAHVWLHQEEVDSASYGAVLGQDGTVHSGFRLRYNPTACAETAGKATQGCWDFLMTATDLQGVTTTTSARSTVEVRPEEWVNLVAEHDPAEKKVRLWVCNVGTPDNPGSGEPVMSEAAFPSTFIPSQASGAFTVGRAKHNGTAADLFHGYIDNVRVFSGEVVDVAKIRRLCQGAEAQDYATGAPGLNALDPTVGE